MKKQIEITDTIDFTGAGAQVPVVYTLPNGMEFDIDNYGTDYSDRGSTLIGNGDWYIRGVDGGFKKITVYIHSATEVRFVDNTGWIMLDQVHDQDFIKFYFKAHVS